MHKALRKATLELARQSRAAMKAADVLPQAGYKAQSCRRRQPGTEWRRRPSRTGPGWMRRQLCRRPEP